MSSTQVVDDTVRITGLRKSYGANDVLRGVDLTLRKGEVHALLGPNGAGKSTLLGCISGAVVPDEGTIAVGARTYDGFTPTAAFEAGTAIIYQHFQLIGSLSVADNIFLGSELTSGARTRYRTQRQEARLVLEQLGVDLDPDRIVDSLNIGEQQLVEIARALRHKPQLLILDEPTAALSSTEVKALLALVRRLARDEDLAIVYVTHLLHEVMEVADAVTVLRDGNVLWTRPRAQISLPDLIRAIAPSRQQRSESTRRQTGRPLLELDAFESSSTGPVSTQVRAGQLLGVFGLLGSGRTDLLEGIAGVRPSSGGTLRIAGTPREITSPSQARAHGIGLVAADRQVQSLFGDLTAQENLLMPHYAGLSHPFRRRRAESRAFKQTASDVNLQPPNGSQLASAFSGGNAQKLVLARWISDFDHTSVLLLDEPTQGVDVGARGDLYQLLRRFTAHGDRAVVFASSDPEEISELADRVLVLVGGRPIGIFAGSLDEETLLALAHGDNSSNVPQEMG